MRTEEGSYRREHRWYSAEHGLAWLFVVGAIILGVVGTLVSFDKIDLRSYDAAVIVTRTAYFQDGLLLFLPAIALGFLALTLHGSEHHVRYDSVVDKDAMRAYSFEHGLAYAGALATIVLGVVGILVGFDVFDKGYIWLDGVTWEMFSIVGGVVTVAMHMAGHHLPDTEMENIRVIVEERVGRALEHSGSTMSSRTAERRL